MHLLIRVLILLGLGVGGYAGYQYWQTGSIPNIPGDIAELGFTTDSITGSVAGDSVDLDALRETGGEQLQTLSDRALDLGANASQILSSGSEFRSIISTDSAKPLHETAIEYGTYVYCKQVVQTYETLREENQ